MLKGQSKILGLFFICFAILGIGLSFANQVISFGPEETKIDGSIPYSVIGKYKAQFKTFKGRISIDDHLQDIQTVDLSIKVNSITSNCPWCDRLVKSRKLLNTARFPSIIFKSDKIIHDGRGYKVKGVLEMHGIKRRMIFPFDAVIINDQMTHRKILNLHGSWIIDRKDFNIIWNAVLDRGGFLVGDYMTVNWGIREYLN